MIVTVTSLVCVVHDEIELISKFWKFGIQFYFSNLCFDTLQWLNWKQSISIKLIFHFKLLVIIILYKYTH